MADLPPKARRAALKVLSRDSLSALADRFNVHVDDRRSHASHVDALVRSRSIDFADVLRVLARDELKEMCEALGLDASGKEKEALVARILAERNGSGGTGNGNDNPVRFTLSSPEQKERRARATPYRTTGGDRTTDYRHDAKRKNNPPAGLIDLEKPPPRPTRKYQYDPHLDPQLQWSGKAEHTSFDVDTVSLHIHERVSAQAIIRAVQREHAQRSLFAEDDLPESKAIDFYAHDVGWSNRLVLGDSLLVMNSLLEREQMAGKVQCVYVDPPYGVKFNSNFQPLISRTEVKDGDDGSLTREPEQIQAYRDTWTLGLHSYLTYLRDRLLIARDLLSESGSVFVQISDENVHHVREVMDEVFDPQNRLPTIAVKKLGMMVGTGLKDALYYLLWYAKSADGVRYNPLHLPKRAGEGTGDHYLQAEHARTREVVPLSEVPGGEDWRPFQLISLTTGGFRENTTIPYVFEGKTFHPGPNKCWRTTREGLDRLAATGRVAVAGKTLRFKQYLDDFPATELTSLWDDTGLSGEDTKRYVVQTPSKVIQRCVLMTTLPGDLVLDPTCGSGTTAYVAEQWGRRWITCDTSRVALAIARQRILTARYLYYRLRSEKVKDGFIYKTVPHITLKSIAQNQKLDACKTQDEREQVIRQSAEQEVLYDQPEEDRAKVRVSGPFTVEAIPVASMEDPSESPIPQLEPEARDDDIARHGRGVADVSAEYGANGATEYTAFMIDQMKKSGGVHFKNGKNLSLATLRPVKTEREWLHAESETAFEGEHPRKVAVSFGPRHAPVTPKQVLDTIQQTRGYDIVLFVGFACDPEALRMIEGGTSDRVFQFVHAAPDILVTRDLLKTNKTTKLFTVFGLPDVKLKRTNGEATVTLSGVDIYDPVTGETVHDDGENVAAWFLDHDYDGRTFCISQAFFPGNKMKNAWERLQKALKGSIDEEKFESLRGTTSIPFNPGKKLAVKVIDDRGNEVVKVVNL